MTSYPKAPTRLNVAALIGGGLISQAIRFWGQFAFGSGLFIPIFMVLAPAFSGFLVAAWVSHHKVRHACVQGGLIGVPFLMAGLGGGGSRIEVVDMAIVVVVICGGCGWLGGQLERKLAGWSQRRNPPRIWNYATANGASITAMAPRRDAVLVLLWRGVAVFLWVSAVVALVLLLWWQPWKGTRNVVPAEWTGPMKSGIYGFIGSVVGGIMAMKLARRHAAESSDVALARDGRAPILHLRPFAHDGMRLHDSSLQDYLGAIDSLTASSSEQALARILTRNGPFLAIGRPGEELPQLGAARMYVADVDWQQVVTDLLSRAQLVVIEAGETSGLQWEIQAVRRMLRPEQVLLFVPFRLTGLARRREDEWAVFRSWAKDVLPDLPESIGRACFLFFESNWATRVLDRKGPPAGHPLAPLLHQLTKDAAFRPRLIPRWV